MRWAGLAAVGLSTATVVACVRASFGPPDAQSSYDGSQARDGRPADGPAAELDGLPGLDRAGGDGPLAVDGPRDLPPSFDFAHADGPAADAFDPRDCAGGLDPPTLMLLTFDSLTSNTVPDATGRHPGVLVGAGMTAVAGPTGCAQALHFPGGDEAHVEIADAADWSLDEGSVDLWLRFDAGGSTRYSGIIGRDAVGVLFEGHFALWSVCDGSLALRLQRGGVDHTVCSAPLPEQRWVHVGINFGSTSGLQLFVDGQRAARTDSVWAGTSCDRETLCGRSTAGGIVGNDNPWVIGANTSHSDDGLAAPLASTLQGAIDHVRISSTPRDFTR